MFLSSFFFSTPLLPFLSSPGFSLCTIFHLLLSPLPPLHSFPPLHPSFLFLLVPPTSSSLPFAPPPPIFSLFPSFSFSTSSSYYIIFSVSALHPLGRTKINQRHILLQRPYHLLVAKRQTTCLK